MKVVDVNAHLHTPYSFSAFNDVPQALDMAKKEGVAVVGINDFYSLDGYGQWKEECAARSLFPLFNIEFISLNVEDQAAGVRVNDPNNPGRTYLSGKGLSYPVKLCGKEAQQLAAVKAESNAQVERMCAKLNAHLDSVKAGFNLNFKEVAEKLTRGSIRERHLAKALRLAIEANVKGDVAEFYERIFGGKALKSALDNAAAVENEIRGNLLKSGGAAFVAEDPKAFKMYLTDVGLLGCMVGVSAEVLQNGDAIFAAWNEALTEQYVLQELITDKDLKVYYYTNEMGLCDVDFVVEDGAAVVPVEVQGKVNLRAKTLKSFVDKYAPKVAIRTSPTAYQAEGRFLHIPLYAL